MEVLKENKLICVDVDENANHNKYYHIKQFDDFSVFTEWGRVDSGSQSKNQTFNNQTLSDKFYDKKIKEKLKGKRNKKTGNLEPYSIVNVLDGTSGTISNDSLTSAKVKSIAKKQIKTSSSVVDKLVDYLVKVNAHTITEGTGGNVSYDVDTGLFSTSLGVVTLDTIQEARDFLDKLTPFVINDDLENSKYKSFLNEYLKLIPQKVPRRNVWKELYTSDEDLQTQNNILDSLESSYNAVVNDPDKKKKEKKEKKVFDVKLGLTEDKKVIDKIKKLYNSTNKSIHSCSHLKVKTVYSVDIETMSKSYKKKGEKIGNIMELWHGTRSANLLSILKGGLVIPPSRSGHVTGRMFSDGLYFSDQSTKSLNYAYGYWGGSSDNNCFMFLADVAMGNYNVPSRPTSSLPPKGYDSYFAKARKSGVMNNEMIVPNVYQCNLKYLIEFSN